MKTILVPVELGESTDAVLGTSLMVANLFGSYMEGFALGADIPDVLLLDPATAGTFIVDEASRHKNAEESQAKFTSFMRTRNVPEHTLGTQGTSWSWNAHAPGGNVFVAEYGRVFDLTVVARRDPASAGASLATAEAALFESGRPILLVPTRAPQKIGETIVVSWNGSTETARAVSFAMPFLLKAAKVIVLTVKGSTVPGPSGEQLTRSLQMHGIKAQALTIEDDKTAAGAVILAQSKALGADLIVKGAYAQSRLRQMIFGGATRDLLNTSTLPLFMAH